MYYDKYLIKFFYIAVRFKGKNTLDEHMIGTNADCESAKESLFFYDIFQNSMISQAVVGKNLNIIFANHQIFQCFQSKRKDTGMLSFGDAFNCLELRHKGYKCGEGENCKNCGILNSVRQILFEHADVQSVIPYSFQAGHRNIEKWFQLYGSQIIWQGENCAALAFLDISEMKQKERHLKKKLTLDLATGTMNKASLLAALHKLMESEEKNCRFTICMIDFDNFKLLNDRYGHLMGDEVLEVFSDISHCHLRKNDMLGRYGGEEFIFVFHNTAPKQSLQILKRIHSELGEYFLNKIEIPVTFSAGAVYVEPVNGLVQYADLIRDVDKMLYRAKKHGRGRAMSSLGETLFTASENMV